MTTKLALFPLSRLRGRVGEGAPAQLAFRAARGPFPQPLSRKRARGARRAILGLLCAVCAGAAAADFADPLDTPAAVSALAPQQPITGLARAGTRLVAVGQRGHILYSDDEGANWTQAQVPVRSDLTAVSFGDAQHGWAVGHDGVVLATRDAGATWTRQLDGRSLGPLLVDWYARHAPAGWSDDAVALLRADARRFADEGPDKPFLDVWFADAQHGFVVGAFNLILATSDGGQSWTPWLDRTQNPRALHLYAIRAVGADVYIAGEMGLLLRLDRAAQQFRAVELPYDGTLFGVAGDAGAVLVFGLRGNVWRSADGGASWARLDSGVAVSLTAATVDAAQGRLLVSQTGHVLRQHGDALAAVPVAQRAPAAAALTLSDGALLIGGPQGLHRIAMENANGR